MHRSMRGVEDQSAPITEERASLEGLYVTSLDRRSKTSMGAALGRGE